MFCSWLWKRRSIWETKAGIHFYITTSPFFLWPSLSIIIMWCISFSTKAALNLPRFTKRTKPVKAIRVSVCLWTKKNRSDAHIYTCHSNSNFFKAFMGEELMVINEQWTRVTEIYREKVNSCCQPAAKFTKTSRFPEWETELGVCLHAFSSSWNSVKQRAAERMTVFTFMIAEQVV